MALNNLIVLHESSPTIIKGIAEFLRESKLDLTLKIISSPKNIVEIINQLEPKIVLFGTAQIAAIGIAELDRLLEQTTNKRCEVIGLNYSFIDSTILGKFKTIISINDSKNAIINQIEKYLVKEEEYDSNDSKVFLTPREEEVIRFLAIGLSNKEIADEMSISSHTVISHRKNITQKLGVKSVSALTIYAVVNKLVSEDDYKKVQ